MQLRIIQKILGLLLMVFSLTMLVPALVSIYYDDDALSAFAVCFLIIVLVGALLWLPVRNYRRELRLRDGFLIVVTFWVGLGVAGALPITFFTHSGVSFIDAAFESISGLTTTGATVLYGIDLLPPSLLIYRQLLQWLGGMGIIVLAVAVLPLLGVGGMQLYRAETPGPMKDNKLTPRITETAKALWYIYLGLTVLCALGYLLAGMSLFDAISHSFSTVAIGGFSTHDQNMGYFDSPLIESVAIVFMLLSGVNFSLHFVAWRRASIRPYLHDSEFRAYLLLLTLAAIVSVSVLHLTREAGSFGAALHHGIFQAVSIGTTTGFTTANYALWPSALPVMLLFTSFIGGCAGSTAGGIKVIRFMLLVRQGLREVHRLIHPSAQLPVKIGRKVMSTRVIASVWGFFGAYIAIFAFMVLVLLGMGLDEVTAFSAVAACINNLGPGLGDVALNYSSLSSGAKAVLCVAMLLGRLEIFTLLVLLSPAFWRR